ncbi:MAG: cytochrome c [Proteobacteria bacterium]|nr:cytochrome c [Pseudomonadota bacterium]
MVLLGACGEPATPLREWTPEDHGQPSVPDPRRVASPSSDEPAQGGEARAVVALWNVSCAGCHGRQGDGRGEARPKGAELADFRTSGWQRARSDEQLAQVIRSGRGLMPAFGDRLNARGIAALVSHIRSLGRAGETAAAPALPEASDSEPARTP